MSLLFSGETQQVRATLRHLITSGGDERIVINEETGLNKYNVSTTEVTESAFA